MSHTNGTKFVALVNKRLPAGIALNALGHASLGLGALLGESRKETMQLLEFQDRDGQSHSNISGLSFIILQGTSENIRTLRAQARNRNIQCVDFTSTMTGGTFSEQLERTGGTPESKLEYYGIVLFGSADELNPLTKKYSLFR